MWFLKDFLTQPKHALIPVQTDLGDIAGSVPDHRNKENIAINRVARIFWCPGAYKSYIYTIL